MAVSQAGGEAPAIDLRTTARGVDGLGSQLRRFRGPILSVGLVILVIAMWQLSASLGWVSSIYTSEPSSIAISAWHFVPSQAGLQDMATSGEELLVGFALSIVVGVTLGLLMGRYLILEETVNLSLNIFYSLPLLALAPIIVLWFRKLLSYRVLQEHTSASVGKSYLETMFPQSPGPRRVFGWKAARIRYR
jgi:hypothetical protein